MEEADEKFVGEILDGFRSQVREFADKMRADDEAVMTLWRDKIQYKVDLIVLRRMIRLEILFETREDVPEVRAEATRRAGNKEPIVKMMEENLAQFEKIGEHNITELLKSTGDEDEAWSMRLAETDKKFRDGLNSDHVIVIGEYHRLVNERDKIRGVQVAKRQAKRLKELRAILKETIERNAEILEEVDRLGIDELDELCLDGKTLEDYCFDK